ncbi:caspase family protein [Chitinophaga sp. NPDC101104]|uniref:caspase family protein n=1 Tax=Chitinophaga sp. NPDC101104 TaxID=3390561 RepID=UPI003CFE99F1
MSVFALLVGVSAYHPDSGVSGLNGCLNDVKAMHDLLRNRFPDDPPGNVRILLNESATRNAVIAAFQEHLCQNTGIRDGDTVLFYYSGHGSHAPSAPEFLALNEDSQGQDETLVLYDSRLPSNFDLADKELALLLSLVPEKAHTVVILDSCHSGSATRSLKTLQHSGLPKFTSNADIPRSLSDYLQAGSVSYAQMHQNGKLELPRSRHLLLAACGRNELAYEDVAARGVFSGWMTRLLQEYSGGLSYAKLHESLYAAIRKNANAQTPQLKTYGGFNPDQFFGRPDSDASAPLLIARFSENEWIVNAGALHGIPADSAAFSRAQVLLYKNADSLAPDFTTSILRVGLTDCVLRVPEGADAGARYAASIINLPPRLSIFISGDAAADVKALLPKDPDIYYHTDAGQYFDYRLDTADNQIKILDKHTGNLVHGVLGAEAEHCHYIGKALAQIAKWRALESMHNPQTAIPKKNIELDVQLMDDDGNWESCNGQEITVDITESRPEIPFRIRLANTSQVEYHVALYHLSPTFSIDKQSPDTDASVLRNGKAIALKCNPLNDFITFMLTEDDINEETEIFQLVYALFPFSDYFVEESQELKREMVTLDSVKSRGLGDGNKKHFRKDWDTQTLRIRIVRNGQRIQKGKQFDNGLISITSTSGFGADVTVTPTHTGAKGLNPAQELQSLFDAEAFTFLPVAPPTRGVPVNTVVELTQLENEASLKDAPLEIRVRQPIGENEAVVALTMQNGIVVPLGFLEPDASGNHRMYVHHAPGEPDERRAAGKSPVRALWFCLLKVVFRRDKEIFKLRYLQFPDGEPEYVKNKVAEKIAQSDRILLVIHGIIGNTKSLSANLSSLLTDKKYDCILTFDYENLNTDLEDIAAKLLDRLQENGVSASKPIDILSHSMGGLISRYMIEELGGDKLVKRLIMAGTPNAGSAFGNLEDVRKWTHRVLTLACNYGKQFLGAWGPFLEIVNKGLSAAGFITNTLGQMDVGSDFLVALNKGPKPPIATRYYILAGDSAKYKHEAEDTGLMEKIELAVGKMLYWSTPNDIAVSVESIQTVPAAYVAESIETSAHHLNYFDYNSSIKILKDMMD